MSSRTEATFYTLAATAAAAEMVATGLYLPYPLLTTVLGGAACLLTALATHTWTTPEQS